MPTKQQGRTIANIRKARDRWITAAEARNTFRLRTDISLDDVRKLLRRDSRRFGQDDFDLTFGRLKHRSRKDAIVHELARHARGYRHLPRPHWEYEDDVAPLANGWSEWRRGVAAARMLLGGLRDLAAACDRPPAAKEGTLGEKPRARSLRAILTSSYSYPEPAGSLRAAAKQTVEILERLITDPIPRAAPVPTHRGPKLGALGDVSWRVGKVLAKLHADSDPKVDSKDSVDLIALFLVGTALAPTRHGGRGRRVVNLDRLARTVKAALYRRY